jgi:hypothetical protein
MVRLQRVASLIARLLELKRPATQAILEGHGSRVWVGS